MLVECNRDVDSGNWSNGLLWVWCDRGRGFLRGTVTMLPWPPCPVRHPRPNGSIADSCPPEAPPAITQPTLQLRQSVHSVSCALRRAESPSSTTLLARLGALWSAGSPTSWVAIAGAGSGGAAIGNAAIRRVRPNATRRRWQHCHSAPERPSSCYRAHRRPPAPAISISLTLH